MLKKIALSLTLIGLFSAPMNFGASTFHTASANTPDERR